MISEGNEIDPPKNGLIQYRPLRHFPLQERSRREATVSPTLGDLLFRRDSMVCAVGNRPGAIQFWLRIEHWNRPRAGSDIVKTSAYFTAPQAGKPAMLFVTAEISPDWHIYSITQAPGGPTKTKLSLCSHPTIS